MKVFFRNEMERVNIGGFAMSSFNACYIKTSNRSETLKKSV
jgi:hypothetical protein